MRDRRLLAAGLVLVTASIVGPAAQSSLGGQTGWRDGLHWQFGHMNFWWGTPESGARIEGAQELTVTASEFVFAPEELTVRLGDAVNLTLVNEGAVPHDLVIAELGVHVAAGPGQQALDGFVANQVGSFEILCTYPGHAASGMVGVLIVEATG